jgi:hypothetical protein
MKMTGRHLQIWAVRMQRQGSRSLFFVSAISGGLGYHQSCLGALLLEAPYICQLFSIEEGCV